MRASVWRDLIYSRVDGAVKAKGPNYYRLLLGQKEGKQNLASKQVLSPTTLVAAAPSHIHLSTQLTSRLSWTFFVLFPAIATSKHCNLRCGVSKFVLRVLSLVEFDACCRHCILTLASKSLVCAACLWHSAGTIRRLATARA